MVQKPVSRKWMKRCIRAASTTEDLRNIIHRPRFRTVEAFDLLEQHCQELCDERPHMSIEVGQLLLEFGRLINAEAEGRASRMLGMAYRRNRRHGEAQAIYNAGLSLPLSDAVRGRLLRCLSTLELYGFNNVEAAMDYANQAIALHEDGDLGIALTIRSKVYAVMGEHSRSAQDAKLALILLDPKIEERPFISAIQSIADALLSEPSVGAMQSALTLIQKVRRNLRGSGGGRYRSIAWAYLDWTEGKINGSMGSHRQALRQLEKVRQRFYENGGDDYLRDALLVTADLATIYDMSGDSGLALSECTEALELAKMLGLNTEVLILSKHLAQRCITGLDRSVRGISFDTPACSSTVGN